MVLACSKNGHESASTTPAPAAGTASTPLAGSWAMMSREGVPALGPPTVGVWTGSRMIVWGGSGCTLEGFCGSGGSYDPARDVWQALAIDGAPAARSSHSGVWTDGLFAVWGGQGCGGVGCGDGALYDPAQDRWRAMASSGAPSARAQHTAVWTGQSMLVWGGRSVPLGREARRLGSGGAYDPARDSWSSLAEVGAPAPRFSHTAVWTGENMLVWGGDASDATVGSADGGSYDPAGQRWRTINAKGAPTARYQHTAIWTGSEMIIWGGVGCGSEDRTRVAACADGAAYRPDNDSWRELNREGAPPAKSGLRAVWTGTYMLVWGGGDSQGYAYDPRADRWQPLPVSGAPRGRTNHVLLWTGREMIAWGGLAGEASVTDGGRLQLAP